MKAIALAAAQGQKIYTLTRANAAQLSRISIDADTRAEIQHALDSGREVTVHERAISAYGWTGSGYIILDAETGAGAYKISGGGNGAALYFLMASIFLLL